MMEWTKQDALDAQRLLRVLVERSERRKASGGLNSPEKSMDQPKRCGQDLQGEVTRYRPGEGPENPTTCPRTDAEMVADRFTMPVLNGNVHRRERK